MAVALEKWPGPRVAPRGAGHRRGGPTRAQLPQVPVLALSRRAREEAGGICLGVQPSGARGLASLWLHGIGRGGPLGPACDSAGVEGGGGGRRQPAACTQGEAGPGRGREARSPLTRPGGTAGSPGITPGPQESGFGPQPEWTRRLKAGAGGGSEGRGQPGAWCRMGCWCPCTSRVTASCWGQTRSSLRWALDCDVTLVKPRVRGVPQAGSSEAGSGLWHCLQPPAGGALQAGPCAGSPKPRSHPTVTPEEFNTMVFLLYLH